MFCSKTGTEASTSSTVQFSSFNGNGLPFRRLFQFNASPEHAHYGPGPRDDVKGRTAQTYRTTPAHADGELITFSAIPTLTRAEESAAGRTHERLLRVQVRYVAGG